MKTGKILLTALASLALSTAAYADDANGYKHEKPKKVTVSNWVPENPVAGQSIYVNMVQDVKPGKGQKPYSVCTNDFAYLISSTGKVYTQKFGLKTGYYLPYMSLSNIGGSDNDTWYKYELEDDYFTTTYNVLDGAKLANNGILPNFSINDIIKIDDIKKEGEWVWVDKGCIKVPEYISWYNATIDWDGQYTWDAGKFPTLVTTDVDVLDTYYTYSLDGTKFGGEVFVPTKIQAFVDHELKHETDIYVTKPKQDGTYYIKWPESKDERSMNHKPHNNHVAFISQNQYDYHVTAQIIADYLNQTEYYGSVYDRLVYLLNSNIRDWKNGKTMLEQLFTEFLLDENRVREALAALPSSIELGTLAINGEAKDVYTFNNLPAVKINPVISYPGSDKVYDIVKLSTNGSDVFTLTNETVEYTEPSTTLNFAPVDPEFNDNYMYPYNGTLTVNVMGLKKQISLIGRNPELSWETDDLVEEKTLRFYERGEETVEFFSFGYDGMYGLDEDRKDVNGIFREKDFTVYEELEDGRLRNVNENSEYYVEVYKYDAQPLNIDDQEGNGSFCMYNLVVKFHGNVVGAHDTKFVIVDNYNGNQLKLNVLASQVALAVTDLKGNDIDKLHFPENGGEPQIIAVHYKGFHSVNEIQQIATAFPSPFTAEFVSAPDNTTSSNRVEGTGTVYLKISCAPAFDYTEFEILEAQGTVSYGREAVVPVALTRTKTLLSTKGVNHMDTEIEMGGEKFESEIEFAAIDFVNYYSLDDIRVYTDVDVFVLNDVIRWHKGSMKDGNFDTLGTVALKYRPNHADVITKGNLYIENIKNHKMIIIPLKGLATSQAKINELNGTTGIENIAAEGAEENGPMYNVAGQRVNNAKGLVIKNGKKYMVK